MIDYNDAEGVSEIEDDARRRRPGVDPLLDELMDTNEASPSAPPLPPTPTAAPAATPPPVSTNGAPASPYTPAYNVEGLDMGKLGGGAGFTPKYQFWRNMQNGMSYEDAVKSIGGTVLDGTRFRLGDGIEVDTRRDEEGDNAAQWLELGGGAKDPRPGTPEERARANGGVDPLTGFRSKGAGQNDEIHALLMRELQGLSGPFDANDPMIQNRVNAFRNQQARGTSDARSALTERANFQGLSSGYVDSGIQAGLEDAALNTAQYEGDITSQEYARRRAELDRLMQMALGSSDGAAARELQAQIAALDRSQQNSQFYDTMGYNINRDQNNLDVIMTDLLTRGGH